MVQDWNTLLRMEEEYIEKMCAEVSQRPCHPRSTPVTYDPSL
jgi:hypothetical protein